MLLVLNTRLLFLLMCFGPPLHLFLFTLCFSVVPFQMFLFFCSFSVSSFHVLRISCFFSFVTFNFWLSAGFLWRILFCLCPFACLFSYVSFCFFYSVCRGDDSKGSDRGRRVRGGCRERVRAGDAQGQGHQEQGATRKAHPAWLR